jgi:hypothetical protein
MLIDAINYDDYCAAEAAGRKMTDEDLAVGKELKATHAVREEVMKQWKDAQAAQQQAAE